MRKLLFLLAIVFMFSCNKKTLNKNENEIVEIDVDMDKIEESLDLKNFILKYEYIPLETTVNSLIGNISKILYYDNKYIIIDNQRNKIFAFNTRGEYLHEIGRQGKGACEFIKIRDVSINKHDSCLNVLGSINPMRIISYSLENETKSEKIFKNILGERFTIMNNNKYVVHYSFPIEHNIGYDLLVIDENGSVLSKHLPFKKTNDICKLPDNCFINFDNNTMFYKTLSDSIYEINQNLTMDVRYVFNFGKYKLPNDIKILFNNNFSEYKEKSGEYIEGISSFFETKENVVFTFNFKGSGYFAFYTKKSNKIELANNVDFFSSQFMNPISAIGNDLVSILNPSELISIRDKIIMKYGNDNWIKFCEDNLIPMELMESINEASNPILIKYSIK